MQPSKISLIKLKSYRVELMGMFRTMLTNVGWSSSGQR